jgi:hypothetical protein
LVGNSLEDNAALRSSPRAIGAWRLPVSPHTFDTLHGILADDAVLAAMLAGDRDHGHHVVCLSAAMLFGHSIT